MIKKRVISLIWLSFFAWAEEAPKVVYIQAVQMDLKEDPKAGAKAIGQVNRGELGQVLQTEGQWVRLKCGKKTGWISKLFVSNHRPVGNADLMKDVKENLVSSTRRRPSSFSVSASARGLMTSERGREGREMYETDGEALEKMEKYSVPKEALKKFKERGQLNME